MPDKEYIEREAVVELFNKWADGYSYIEVPAKDAIACVRAIPAADVRPVVRGRWIRPTRVPDSMLSECSVCGFDTGAYTFNFCPNCGAKMGGEEE